MLNSLLNKIKIQKTNQYELDDPRLTLEHREIILNKPFLKKLYEEWYKTFIDNVKTMPDGILLELGSGGGFFKDMFPEVITSDIMDTGMCDKIFSAEEIPYEDNSLSGIFMIDVLHHLPNCSDFFKEAQRTLKDQGKIIMVEPAITLLSKFIFKKFHHEPIDVNAKAWTFPSSGPLSGANSALPWIIFERDIKEFSEKYPELKLVNIHYHTPFRYLLSGGVSYVSFVPSWSFETITFLEKLISPFSRYLAMFQTIEIVKSPNH